MKIRIKFSKQGSMRFIGHLDLMRYFQKAIRRSGIPIKYSTGYSPHQIMSFAAPLGMGLEGLGEYMDIEVEDDMILSSTDAVKLLNSTMAEGTNIKSFLKLSDDSKKSMSIVGIADYVLTPEKSFDHDDILKLRSYISRFLESEKILIQKESKSGVKETDIRPFVYMLEEREGNIFMRLSQGSQCNLKPSIVIDSLIKISQENILADIFFHITRLEIYDKQMKCLEEYGSVLT